MAIASRAEAEFCRFTSSVANVSARAPSRTRASGAAACRRTSADRNSDAIRVEAHTFGEPIARFRVALEIGQGDRLTEARLRDSGIQFDDCRVLLERRLESSPAAQRVRQLQPSLQVGRLTLHGRCEAFDRQIGLPIRQQQHAEAVVCARERRVSTQEFLQLLNGPRHITSQRQ